MKPVIYISGPMSGLPEYNYPAFFAASGALRGNGWLPVNPARIGVRPPGTHADYLQEAISLMVQGKLDAIYMLNGWKDSKGARLERDIALALGCEHFYQTQGVPDASRIAITAP